MRTDKLPELKWLVLAPVAGVVLVLSASGLWRQTAQAAEAFEVEGAPIAAENLPSAPPPPPEHQGSEDLDHPEGHRPPPPHMSGEGGQSPQGHRPPPPHHMRGQRNEGPGGYGVSQGHRPPQGGGEYGGHRPPPPHHMRGQRNGGPGGYGGQQGHRPPQGGGEYGGHRPPPRHMGEQWGQGGPGMEGRQGPGRGQGHRPPDPETVFKDMDADGDGQVSKAEFTAFHERMRPPRREARADGGRRSGPGAGTAPSCDREKPAE